jgi:hypothetical protein
VGVHRVPATPYRWGRSALILSGATALTGAAFITAGLAGHDNHEEPPLSVYGTNHVRTAAGIAGSGVRPILTASAPVTVSIPAIGVRSDIVRLGQQSDGSMEVPAVGPDYDKAGWYRYSPMPGSRGPAIIVGHLDSAAAGPSVFFRLGSLRPHDRVRITRVDGLIVVFEVDTVGRYPKSDFPSRLVYGNTSYAALRLITCGGRFDRASGHYVDNVVVTASMISFGTPGGTFVS